MDLQYAEGWRPEEGDTVVGTVTDIALGRSSFGARERYPIITIKPDDGGDAVAIHGFHAALKARFTDLKPNVGERIGVKFVGMRPHKTDPTLTVADYIVKVDGRGAANVWAQVDTDNTTAPPVNSADFNPPAQTTMDSRSDDDIPF